MGSNVSRIAVRRVHREPRTRMQVARRAVGTLMRKFDCQETLAIAVLDPEVADRLLGSDG